MQSERHENVSPGEGGQDGTPLEKNKKAVALTLAAILGGGGIFPALVNFASTNQSSQLVRVYFCIFAGLLAILGMYWLFAKRLVNKQGPLPAWLNQSASGWAAFGIVFAGGTFLLLVRLFQGDEGAVWEKLPMPALLLGLCALLTLCRPLLRKEVLCKRADPVALAGAVLFSLICYFFHSYLVNLPGSGEFQTHHVTAVTQSIYNVAFHTPYTVATTGMYGHYALFFLPLLELMGHNSQQISFLLAVCGVITQGLLDYCLIRSLRANWLSLIAILASCFVPACSGSVYLQVRPLRQLWPLAIMAYLLSCFLGRSGFTLKKRIVGYILCGLAILWNTDSGLVATAAFAVSVWIWGWCTEKPVSGKMGKLYLESLLGSAGAVAMMVAVINVYNLLCGGQLLLRGCFYPLIGGDGYTQSLQTSLMESGTQWLVVVALFLLAFLVGMTPTRLLNATSNKRNAVLAVAAVMGLAQCYYFFNRAIAGTTSIAPYAVLCAAMLADWGIQRGRAGQIRLIKGAQEGIGRFFALELGLMLVGSVLQTPVMIAQRNANAAYSAEGLEALAKEVSAWVPADTYAFGYYTQEIYSQLGWNPGYHQRDVSDMAYDIRRARGNGDETSLGILAEVNAQDSVLVSAAQTDALLENPLLLPEFGIPSSEPVFYYYSKNTPAPVRCDLENAGKNSLAVLQARAQGIHRAERQYEFWVQPWACLELRADEIEKNGLILRASAPSNVFAESGQKEITVSLTVEQETVGTLRLTEEQAGTAQEIYVAAQALPAPPENGLYHVELLCEGVEPTGTGGCYCLNYIGAPRSVNTDAGPGYE